MFQCVEYTNSKKKNILNFLSSVLRTLVNISRLNRAFTILFITRKKLMNVESIVFMNA